MISDATLWDASPGILAVLIAGLVYLAARYTRWRFDRQRALEAHRPGAADPSFRRDLQALDELILKLTREPQERRADAVAKVWAAKEALLAVAGEAAARGADPAPAGDRHAAE